MRLIENDVLLRIFIGENTKHNGKLVYELIVLKAKSLKIAGATVIKGILGYGASFHLHSAKLVDLADNLPVVIEIIDSEDKINEILPFIDEVITDGLVTTERVNVIRYGHK